MAAYNCANYGPHGRHEARSLRSDRSGWRGRDGGSLPRQGYAARPRRGDQDPAALSLTIPIGSAVSRRRRSAAGALNHPNVLVVHDVGDHDHAPYVVCELLEGTTLREQLTGTPLPARRAIDYAIQIARGLAAAHERGIVHRDLKPEKATASTMVFGATVPDGRLMAVTSRQKDAQVYQHRSSASLRAGASTIRRMGSAS